MAKEEQSVIEQLKDALLRAVPAGGAVIGGLFGSGILKDVTPPIIGFMVGGAVGGVIVYAVLRGFFWCVNSTRDRSKNG